MRATRLLPRDRRLPPRRDLWWRGAVLYQIWPRSFADGNGDGIGDLAGITGRLAHIARLGVDAIWISPFYRSPMKDWGYDIADHCAVDPSFGSLADFDRLLARAHELGLRVLVDFVPSHTSDRHPWFLESREDRANPRADWYVWADPRPDGTPPNNWLSVFGGPAWQWEPRRGQYYLHNFLVEQPDLDLHRPEVRNALLDIARFWLERGIDGFRLDAIEFAFHDTRLRNNPPRRAPPVLGGAAPGSPWTMQQHRFDKGRAELNALFLQPLWCLTEEYGGRVLLGEVTGDHARARIARHTNGGGLDMAYGFDLLTGDITASRVREAVEEMEKRIGGGWMCWAFSNHDVQRAPSRLPVADPPDAARLLLPVLLCCLPGTPCLYQGDELGLEEAELSFEDLRDPFGIAFWPRFAGRDGCRTPIPWESDAPHGGFSTAEPWIPFYEPHRRRAVDRQYADPGSVYARLRRFLAFRRGEPALRQGDIRFLDAVEPLLAFTRGWRGRRLLCAFDLGGEGGRLRLGGDPRLLFANAVATRGSGIELAPWGLAIAQLDGER